MAAQPTAHHYDTILSPMITEKATILLASRTRSSSASPARRPRTRSPPRSKSLFKVNVLKVNTLVDKGKTKRFRGIMGRRVDVKKAIVTLAEGQSIDVTTGL